MTREVLETCECICVRGVYERGCLPVFMPHPDGCNKLQPKPTFTNTATLTPTLTLTIPTPTVTLTLDEPFVAEQSEVNSEFRCLFWHCRCSVYRWTLCCWWTRLDSGDTDTRCVCEDVLCVGARA
ncbi:uncharacterized protein TM35_000133190 [Trypanosoma theileri]|uniref:Uncharacterized protein n=1 Tax=Trypanosoma theileri TaxID=67003 RepID=A0A1X0NX88_9TRYP|nr:uncharacterized protein TM35_000133190 [Trypanosoma theileri]ORC89315.1 hypothetical protein TM35_000133190 [Trypanosoma theileri]